MTRSPLDTAHEMLDALAARDRDRWEAVVAEDASLIIPYTPEGPTRFDGRASFADLTWNFFRSWKVFAWRDVELHVAQDDPGYIFGTGRSSASADDQSYSNRYCYIFRIRGEQVLEYSEYFNPLRVIETGAGERTT